MREETLRESAERAGAAGQPTGFRRTLQSARALPYTPSMRPLRVHYFQHVSFEDPAYILDWLHERGHGVTASRQFEEPWAPDTDQFDMLIAMGGPMSVNDTDTYEWIEPEVETLRQAVDAGKPVLGVCLGAQLLARALGSEVFPSDHKEIGWFPVTVRPERRGRELPGESRYVGSSATNTVEPVTTYVPATATELFDAFPPQLITLHWHGETFTLPENARLVAQSTACKNQLFVYNESAIGVQFHLESSMESVQRLVDNVGDEITEGPYMMPAAQILARADLIAQNNRYMAAILRYLESKAYAAAGETPGS